MHFLCIYFSSSLFKFSMNNSKFGHYVDRTNPIENVELEIKDTTDTEKHASFLDLHLEIDS